MAKPRDKLIVSIAVFKLAKAAALLTVGLGALSGGRAGVDGLVAKALVWLAHAPGHHALQEALGRVAALRAITIRRLGTAFLCYAAVFIVEGLGLLAGKPWAEWLTLVVTASFIPLEVYELVHHPSAGKVATIAVNAAIVAYLAWRRLRR
jgi:uncharacterized membrane protein (DUF2068 family)